MFTWIDNPFNSENGNRVMTTHNSGLTMTVVFIGNLTQARMLIDTFLKIGFKYEKLT